MYDAFGVLFLFIVLFLICVLIVNQFLFIIVFIIRVISARSRFTQSPFSPAFILVIFSEHDEHPFESHTHIYVSGGVLARMCTSMDTRSTTFESRTCHCSLGNVLIFIIFVIFCLVFFILLVVVFLIIIFIILISSNM